MDEYIPPLNYEVMTLPNGLRVVTHSMPHSYSIAATVSLAVGGRDEEADVAGVSHFVEHMLFKGTERWPTPRDLSVAIEGVGGTLNAATEKELTTYWAKVPTHHVELALDLLADMMQRALFLEGDVRKERHVIEEELLMIEDTPQELVNELVDQLIWPGHPLGWEILGTIETLERLNRDVLHHYYRSRYAPNRAVLSVVGNVSHQEVVDFATRLFGGWSGEPDAQPRVPPPQSGARWVFKEKDIEQVHLCLGAGGLPRLDRDRRVLDVQNLILGGGMSSRLFQEIRERLSLAYDVQAYVDYFADCGASVISVATEPESAVACMAAILQEVRHMVAEPPGADELVRAKEFLKGRTMLAMEDTLGLSQWLGGQLLLNDKIQPLCGLLEEIEAVTADDVLRVSQKVFAGDTLCLAAVGPAMDVEPLVRLLE
ncbi:MAG: insulinase family protein [Chloroflexi bacterium]|nr:insulinase family protein [Chloroflexota bacterium]